MVDVAAKPAPSPGADPLGGALASSGPWPYVPRLKLTYGRFGFSRMPTTSGTTTTPVAPVAESFESVSLDLYPISSYLRVGLSTQFGWESGQFMRTGDYFAAESAAVGIQWPGRFTPFAAALAGGGYMRRREGDTNTPSAYWQLGVDAGLEIYFAGRAYGSLAIGYLHPGNLFFAQKSLESVKSDTWSLKIGVGI
jgi:hypothetical protein